MNKKLSLTKRTIYLTLILLPIPLLINLVIITLVSFSSIKKDISKSLQLEANNYILSFEEILKLNELYLNQLENILLLKEFDPDFQIWLSSTFKDILKQQAFDYHLVDSNNVIISSKESFVQQFLISYPNFLKQLDLKENKNSLILVLDNLEIHEKQSFLLVIKKIFLNQKTYYLIKSENIINIWNWIHKFKLGDKNINVILASKQGEILASSPTISFSCLTLPKTKPSYNCIEMLTTKMKFSPNLSIFSLHNKKYFSYVLEDKKIKDLIVITFSPFQEIIWKSLKSPLEICLLFLLTLTIGVILIWIISNKMDKPLYNLSLCMEEVKKGNYHVRFSPLPLGGEFNYLGKKFNHTLTLLLNSIEKTEKEKIKRKKLEHELSIIKEIQKQILFSLPLKLPYISNKIVHIPGVLIKGVFQEWQEITIQNNTILRYGIGISEDFGLTSCLYSITIRSLFLAYSKTSNDLEKVIELTKHDFLQGHSNLLNTFNMFAFDYDPIKHNMTYCLIGQRFTIIKKCKKNVLLLSSIQNLQKNLEKKTVSISPKEELLIITNSTSKELKYSCLSEKLVFNLIEKDQEKTIDSLVSEIKEIYTLNKMNSQEVVITILNFK